MPNETPPELEGKILEMTERYPTYSYLRISQQLRLVGVGVSPSAVRYVWQRHGLTLRFQRLLWLEQKPARARIVQMSLPTVRRPNCRNRTDWFRPSSGIPIRSADTTGAHRQLPEGFPKSLAIKLKLSNY